MKCSGSLVTWTALGLATAAAVGSDGEASARNPDPGPSRGGAVLVYVGSGPNCDSNDLQATLGSVASGSVIRLENKTFTGNFEIRDKDLTLVGGFDDCTSQTPGFSSTLDATGNSGNTVLDIYQSAGDAGGPYSVTLENLNIENGDESSPFERGGGMQVEGNVRVDMTDVVVQNNTSSTGGGGIQVAEGASLVILGDSVIQLNSAEQGGGIACFGDPTTPGDNQSGIIIDRALLFNNEARLGGGIYSSNCGVFSHAGGVLQGISGNTASADGSDPGQGGGIYATLSSEIGLIGVSPGFFVPGDPDSPATVSGNTADDRGGGVYLTGDSTMFSIDGVIESNEAGSNGGGIAMNQGGLTMERGDGTTCQDDPCSRLTGNTAAAGGALWIDNTIGPVRGGISNNVEISQTFISGNTADGNSASNDGFGSVVSLINGLLTMEAVVAHNNQGQNSVFQRAATSMVIAWSTWADATINGTGELLRIEGGISPATTTTRLWSNIFWQPGEDVVTLDTSSGSQFDLSADCLIANELATLPSATRSVVDDPQFVAPADDDYHISALSPAVDFCDDSNAPQFKDMDEQSRGLDVAPNAITFDVGADESLGFIFSDGFEGN